MRVHGVDFVDSVAGFLSGHLTGNDARIPKSFFFQSHRFLFGNVPVNVYPIVLFLCFAHTNSRTGCRDLLSYEYYSSRQWRNIDTGSFTEKQCFTKIPVLD